MRAAGSGKQPVDLVAEERNARNAADEALEQGSSDSTAVCRRPSRPHLSDSLSRCVRPGPGRSQCRSTELLLRAPAGSCPRPAGASGSELKKRLGCSPELVQGRVVLAVVFRCAAQVARELRPEHELVSELPALPEATWVDRGRGSVHAALTKAKARAPQRDRPDEDRQATNQADEKRRPRHAAGCKVS